MSSKRLIVAAVVLPALIAYIYLVPELYFLALLMGVSVVAMREFSVMYAVRPGLYVPGIIIGGILFYVLCRHPAYILDGIFISLFLLLGLRLLIGGSPRGCMADIGTLGIGFFYISGFLSYQWFLREDAHGVKQIFLLYGSVWIADSAAYYIGTYFGKNKLYQAVSPNKTIEGAFGSLIGGAVGAVVMKIIFQVHEMTTLKTVLIGGILGIAAVIGDLVESMFKRDAGVKDSSSLIPGHGGLLDKIDGILIAGPILYYLLRYL